MKVIRRCPVSCLVLLVQSVILIIWATTRLFDYSPWGSIHPGQWLGVLQVSTGPIFLHQTQKWILALLVHPLILLMSPLGYGLATGERTLVIPQVPAMIQNLVLLFTLETLWWKGRPDSKPMVRTMTFGAALFGLAYLIVLVRTGTGLLSYHLGRSLAPRFCFSDAMRQVAKGSLPILLGLYFVVRQTVRPKSLATWHFGALSFTSLDLVLVALLIPISSSLIWWNVLGISFGLILAIFLKPTEPVVLGEENTDEPSRWGLLGSSSLRALLLTAFFALSYYLSLPTRLKSPHELDFIGDAKQPLVTFLVMTAPRKNEHCHLRATVKSYLDAFPADLKDPLYNRIKMVVFTHFTTHPGFDNTEAGCKGDPKAEHYVQFVRVPGTEYNQRKHFDKAMRMVADELTPQTHYIGIIEDDFPLCPGKWPEILRLIRDANRRIPDHCGVFIGTGGSGLLIRRNRVEDALASMNAGKFVDVGLQDCLRGTTCPGCQVVVPNQMLMYHVGHDTSTMNHRYSSNDYQCGARHPFISELDAVVL